MGNKIKIKHAHAPTIPDPTGSFPQYLWVDQDSIDAQAKLWDRLMKDAEHAGLIHQASGGIAVLVHPETQLREGIYHKCQIATDNRHRCLTYDQTVANVIDKASHLLEMMVNDQEQITETMAAGQAFEQRIKMLIDQRHNRARELDELVHSMAPLSQLQKQSIRQHIVSIMTAKDSHHHLVLAGHGENTDAAGYLDIIEQEKAEIIKFVKEMLGG